MDDYKKKLDNFSYDDDLFNNNLFGFDKYKKKNLHKDSEMDLISNIDSKSDKPKKMSKKERLDNMNKIEEEMKKAAASLDFERAMELRDILLEMKSEL